MVSRSGANLALLLFGGFRTLADSTTEELAKRGYKDFRPTHDFAMRAIAAGADSASDLARQLSISKQAAAKTIAVLESRGYVKREPDTNDARRKHLRVTSLGSRVLRTGEEILNAFRYRWAEQIGMEQLEFFETFLAEKLGTKPSRITSQVLFSQEDAGCELLQAAECDLAIAVGSGLTKTR